MPVGLTSSPIFALLRDTAGNVSWRPFGSFLPTGAKAEAWLYLLGHANTADSCLLSQLSQTGLLVYP
ncbi:mCG147837 [Mus musculus]|nr:mCG147837 [Mus musculus]